MKTAELGKTEDDKEDDDDDKPRILAKLELRRCFYGIILSTSSASPQTLPISVCFYSLAKKFAQRGG